MMKGYKTFKSDWTCRDFQYKVGETYELDAKPICCEQGFHFCTELKDCAQYYYFNSDTKYAEVEALGDIDFDKEETNSKCCTNKIKIVREITWEEVIQLLNFGIYNSDIYNVGDYNTGYSNVGDYNIGIFNTGDDNKGNFNTGDDNQGTYNSGYFNIGNENSGNSNQGKNNAGNYNIGNYNTGDWNKTDYSTGCFNTQTNTILMFNKPSNWTLEDWHNSIASVTLSCMPTYHSVWIESRVMTEEEKIIHPDYKMTGGYLKIIDETKNRQSWWNNLGEEHKIAIKSLPNFDPEIFKEITGIKV